MLDPGLNGFRKLYIYLIAASYIIPCVVLAVDLVVDVFGFTILGVVISAVVDLKVNFGFVPSFWVVVLAAVVIDLNGFIVVETVVVWNKSGINFIQK